MKRAFLQTFRNVLTLSALFLFISANQLSAQATIGRQKVDQFPVNSWGGTTYGLTYLPSDYNQTNDSYPLIIFLHGIGEAGSGPGGLWGLIGTGLPQIIANGWDPQAKNPADGKTYKFIVVSPQAPQWSYGYEQLQYILPDILNRYRVDPSRVYVTGLSAGGACAWSAITNTASFAQKIAADVPVCAAGTNTSNELQELPLVGGTFGVKIWTICGTQDSFWNLATNFTNAINNANPAPSVPAIVTGLDGYTHNSGTWNTVYDPGWKNSGFNKLKMNIYEWMLQYTRGGNSSTSQSAVNAPTANAGNAQTITLPANSVTLNGSGTTGKGYSPSYSWSKISGPSQYSFSNSNIANPKINDLVAGTYTFRLTVTSTKDKNNNDNTQDNNLTATDDVTVTVNAAPAPPPPPPPPVSYTKIPSKIEAKNYSAMSGVQTENTTDAGGGQDVGWIDNNDWMDYAINVPAAGSYTLNFRIATPNDNAQFQVRKSDGTVLATVRVPNSGGYQSWQTTSATVALPAGNQVLRLVSVNNDIWNINWLQFLVVPVSAPVNYTTIPGRIEAENWSAMSGVQTENTYDPSGGGQNVGWIDKSDWMEYSINAPSAGTYNVNFRIATPNDNAQFEIRKSDGSVLTTVKVPNTGGYQSWQTMTATVTLAAGKQTVRLVSVNSDIWNINWLEFANTSVVIPPAGYITIPAKIEAENYSAMSGVQTENTYDESGGQNVGWIDNGDWLEYAINAPSAGTYTLTLRIATPNNNAQFQVKKPDGSVLATVKVPNTGGYQSWQTTSVTLTLPAGNQSVRLVSVNNDIWNINWLQFASGSATPSPFRIEAENYGAMNGVQKENTMDAGGGQDVNWIDYADWMDYGFTVAAAGNYTVNFRIASPNNNAQLQILKADGTLLTTVAVPNTGDYQKWQTVSASLPLVQGWQTIRIVSTGGGGWNFNWMEFSYGSPASNRIEAENWAAMSGVQKENTLDAGGGQDVGWIDYTDWMDYTINTSSAGTYTINFRIATPNSNAQFQVKKPDGTILSTVNVPNTGDFQKWQTISASVPLVAGQQTIRLYSTGGGQWNINWLEMGSGSTLSTVSAQSNRLWANEQAGTGALTVYPNPIRDQFDLQVNNQHTGTMNIQIADMSGAVKRQFTVTKSNTGLTQSKLSIENLPAGTYILKVQLKDWTDIKKIIKQ